jgi:hypothetical protein
MLHQFAPGAQRRLRIRPTGEKLLLSIIAVSEAPDFRPVGLDQQEEACGISLLVGPIRRLERLDCNVGEHFFGLHSLRTGSNPERRKFVGKSCFATNNLTKKWVSCKGST